MTGRALSTVVDPPPGSGNGPTIRQPKNPTECRKRIVKKGKLAYFSSHSFYAIMLLCDLLDLCPGWGLYKSSSRTIAVSWPSTQSVSRWYMHKRFVHLFPWTLEPRITIIQYQYQYQQMPRISKSESKENIEAASTRYWIIDKGMVCFPVLMEIRVDAIIRG